MKVILVMSISVNGFIADKNGSEDFLSHQNWIEFSKIANQIGCIIWGRKTYQEVITWPPEYLEALKEVKKVIVSNDQNLKLQEGFQLANSPHEALDLSLQLGFHQVILTGGATLNSSFATLGLIDEVILNVEPVLLGQGTPLFAPSDFATQLRVTKVEQLPTGLLQLHLESVS